jgi:uncharacterized membrane protein
MEIFITVLVKETTPGIVASPAQLGVEDTIINLVLWLKLLLETIGALTIGIGVLIAGYYLFQRLVPPERTNYNRIRLILARYLALALEFQLGADILSTAIAPTWDQIGKLGAIAIIRTALNYFLSREMKEQREATTAEAGLTEDPGNKENVKFPKQA